MNRWYVAALFCVAAAGCGHARLVSRSQTGGIYALEGDRNEAMKDAQTQMSQHCQGPYAIVAEGEQVVGTDSAQQNETYVAKDGTVVNQGGQSTRDATEWRVQYECGPGGGPPPTMVPSEPSQSYPQQPPPPPPPGSGY